MPAADITVLDQEDPARRVHHQRPHTQRQAALEPPIGMQHAPDRGLAGAADSLKPKHSSVLEGVAAFHLAEACATLFRSIPIYWMSSANQEANVKRFADLSEQEILALAISSEEEDSRIYHGFADGLRERYPTSAQVFMEMAAEEVRHRSRLFDLYREKFGDYLPLIRRQDVKGFIQHK